MIQTEKPILSNKCEFVNPTVARFCNRCAAPLDTQTALNLEESIKGLSESFAQHANGELIRVVKEPEKISKKYMERLAHLLLPHIRKY